MSRPFNLRTAKTRSLAGADPTPRARHAQTAGGREILGFWGWVERVVLMGTFASIALGVVAFTLDYEDRRQVRADMQSDAVARAWALVTTPASGNSGKREALEFLHRRGVALTGIDLSCATMGGEDNWDAGTFDCERRTYLGELDVGTESGNGANFSGANLAGANLRGARLQGAGFHEATLDGAYLFASNAERAVFLGAKLRHSNLSIADLRGSFWFATKAAGVNLRGANLASAHLSGADLATANLTSAILDGATIQRSSFRGALLDHASFRAAQVSGSDFSDATWMGKPDFSGAWAWLDQPPTELDAFGILLCAYDPRADTRDVAPDPCIAPGASE